MKPKAPLGLAGAVAQASRILAARGFRNIRNVQGGLLAWQAAEYPVRR